MANKLPALPPTHRICLVSAASVLDAEARQVSSYLKNHQKQYLALIFSRFT